MIISKRARNLWQFYFPNECIRAQFDKRFPSKRPRIRPEGDGLVRRETPCGAILVIARGDYIIDVYPVKR